MEAIMEELKSDIFEKLRRGSVEFPSQQRHLCQFILDNFRQVAFMNVEVLANSSGVSPATVVRTTAHIGYSSFHDFLDDIKNVLIPARTSLWWQVEESWKGSTELEDISDRSVLTQTTLANVESLHQSLTPLLLESFERAADILKSTRSLSILGLRSSHGAALYAHSLFRQFLSHVYLPSHFGSDDMYAHLVDLSKDDAVLALSLGGPHYASRTVEAIEYVSSLGVPVILIATDLACPAANSATVVLPVTPSSGHYSVVSVMNVLDALIVVLGRHNKKSATSKLRVLEKLLKEKHITL